MTDTGIQAGTEEKTRPYPEGETVQCEHLFIFEWMDG